MVSKELFAERFIGSFISNDNLNIGTGSRLSLNSLVELLNEIFGSQIAPVYEFDRVLAFHASTLPFQKCSRTIAIN